MFLYLLSLLEWQRKRREKQNNGTTKSRALLSPFLSLAESANAAKEERGKYASYLWRDFLSLEESVVSLKFASEEYEAERDTDALFFVFFSVLFGSDEDAERRAEKTERG